MEHPIEYYRLQKPSKVDEIMPARFSILIHAYEAIRLGRITEIETIRDVARQFAAIAAMPDLKEWFPYDAEQIAMILHSRASTLEMEASVATDDQSGSHGTTTDPDLQRVTEEIRLSLTGLQEGLMDTVSVPKEISEALPESYRISDEWTGLLKFAEVAEQEAQALAAKGVLEEPIDHDDLWKEWEIE